MIAVVMVGIEIVMFRSTVFYLSILANVIYVVLVDLIFHTLIVCGVLVFLIFFVSCLSL